MSDDVDDAVTCEGSGEARIILREWFKNLSKSVELEGDVPLELWNVGQGAEGSIYETEWDITEPVEDVIDEILEHAEEDAINVGRGKIRFKVIVQDRKKFGRAGFSLTIPKTDDFSSDDIEDIEELATRKGLLTQLMRHQEKTMKVGLGGSDKVMAHMTRMLDTAHKRIAELEGMFTHNAKAYEELLSGKHVRDLELRKLENEERQKAQVVSVLMQGMPLLLNKFLAGKPPEAPPGGYAASTSPGAVNHDDPANVSPLEQMIGVFLQSFTPMQLQDIMAKNVFSGEQMMMFMKIAELVQSRHQAREAASQAQAQAQAAQ